MIQVNGDPSQWLGFPTFVKENFHEGGTLQLLNKISPKHTSDQSLPTPQLLYHIEQSINTRVL